MIPVILLIVTAKMLDGYKAALNGLNASGDGRRHLTGYNGILRVIFKISPAQRIAVKVHTRCQPNRHADFFHFVSYGLADFLQKRYIPALRL